MKKISSKIVFFGSGPVAAESLRLLLKNFEVEAVVTKPTTTREMQAIIGEVPLYSVANKAELDALIEEKNFGSKLGILIDFGIMVSQKVIDSFEYGIVNSHFSLLPEWRGADPISFSILSGQVQTGVSLMILVEAMDEGPILEVGLQPLDDSIDSTELTKKLIHLSDALLVHAIPRYLSGETKGIDQSIIGNEIPNYPTEPSYSRKLTKEDGILDFAKPAAQLQREVRAFIEWPKSRTEIAGKDVVVLKASVQNAGKTTAGVITKTVSKEIAIETAKGTLIVEQLKPAGKQAMSAEAFLAGYGKDIPKSTI
jgi:methionyl-tRNA formyltransferase